MAGILEVDQLVPWPVSARHSRTGSDRVADRVSDQDYLMPVRRFSSPIRADCPSGPSRQPSLPFDLLAGQSGRLKLGMENRVIANDSQLADIDRAGLRGGIGWLGPNR